MRNVLRAMVGVCVLTLALASFDTSGSSATTGPVSASGTVTSFFANSPIKHVVIIYQENHSFDDVLGAVCRYRTTPCDGRVGPATFADGVRVSNKTEPDVVPIVSHVPSAQIAAIHNNWDQLVGCTQADHYACVAHFRRVDIPNLNRLADRFVVSDRTFASDPTASFGAHITLASGTLDGFTGRNPIPPQDGSKLGPGWGCASNRIVGWQNSPAATEAAGSGVRADGRRTDD